MKSQKQTRLYNIILPLWLLWIFPQVWLVVLPANLAVDCLVLFCALLALNHPHKKEVLKRLWWKFWLLGFAADGVGVLWLFLGMLSSLLPTTVWTQWWMENISYITGNCFRSPLSFFWMLLAVALAGLCIYAFDLRAMKGCPELSDRQKRTVALAMAVVTAPWLFFIPMVW